LSWGNLACQPDAGKPAAATMVLGKKQPADAIRGTVSLTDRPGALSSEITTNPDRKS